MPFLTPQGTDTLVNTETADGQISPRVVALADGKYMVIWVGSVILPVVPTGGTIAPAYANADIRAQIYNADGTPSGGEIVINTTTAGGQIRPVVAQLSDGNVLISWHDGVGPSGGSAETVSNTIRAQEFTSTGVPTGAEFAIGNSNGRLHSLAPTPTGGFVVTYQEGGVGGPLAVGNIVTQVYNSSNVQTSSFIVDNTQPLASITYTAVESDGDIVVFWNDRQPTTGAISWRGGRFDANGAELGGGFIENGTNISGVTTLSTGGHVVFGFRSLGTGQSMLIFAQMNSADGSLFREVQVAQVPSPLAGPVTLTPLANGGFIASWGVDSDPGTGVNVDIMAQAFNAIGNPIGSAFQVNSLTALNQNTPAFVQLTDGDIVAAWIDDSLLNGDTSGTGINMRRIDYDPVNQNPAATNFTFSLYGIAPGTPANEDPEYIDGFFGLDGYDADGDPLVLSSVGNATNGTVTLNPNGTLTMLTNPGASGPLSFDYTLSDGQGGFSTARATVTLPSDSVTLRVGETATIDFLANDYYTPGAGATPFTVTPPAPLLGGSIAGNASLVTTPSGLRIFYDPLRPPLSHANYPDTHYFDLLVGQTTQVRFFYHNNEIGNVDVVVTLQGWAQLGGAGADNLVGGAQADHLSGGTGTANTLTGGAGNDWYTVSAVGDSVIEFANEGTDWVRSNLVSFTLPAHVENLHLFGFLNSARQGNGNAENNLITSYSENAALYGLDGHDTLIGSSFNDTLDGGNGDDRLDGGFGTDMLVGGLGNDMFIVDRQADLVFEDANGGTDLVESSVSFYLYANIENLTLTGGAFFGVGNELANVLRGNNGENLLIAGAGNDTVRGGGARDAIFGEDGDDILNGDAGIDYIVGGIGNDTIAGGDDADEIYGQDGDDTIRGGSTFHTDIMVGGAGNDTIYGNSGQGDYDLLYGNEGNDIFYVDTPADLVFEQAGEGTDTVYAEISGAGFYLYDNIENLTLLGDTPFGVGNGLNNNLTGSATGNYLLGGAGNDTLNGMDGNDVLFGEAGNDVFVIQRDTGADVIGDFTIGQDRIDLSGFNTSFAQLQSRFVQDGNVGAIRLASGDLIVLHNVTMSQLTAADFIFAPVSEAPAKSETDIGGIFEGENAFSAGPVFADSGLERWGTLRTEIWV